MPNLPAHIDLAYEVAERLRSPRIESNMGHYLLGSTTPDIRAITKRDRAEYHFASLDFENVGEGVRRMLSEHPELRPAGDGRGPTEAFVAGYVTHLLLDEAWIVGMYRPNFGDGGLFGDAVRGQIMDRVLQLELDRRSQRAVARAVPLMAGATGGVEVAFLPAATLDEWRVWVVNFVRRGFSWDRLRFMARRVARGDESHPAHAVAQEFLDGMPSSLARLLERVTPEDLLRFRENAVDTLVYGVREYLA